MTEELADTFRSRADYREQEPGVFAVEDLDFEAQVIVDEGTVTLVHELPTLDATVVGETVAPVVQSGWAETFERRVQDVTGVIDGPVSGPTVAKSGETIRVRIELQGEGQRAPEMVRHAVEFIESTWVEGIIPGYDYDERVQAIRNRAMATGEDGTPP